MNTWCKLMSVSVVPNYLLKEIPNRRMEDHFQNLHAYFMKNTEKEHKEIDEDEMMIEGDYWEITHPSEVES